MRKHAARRGRVQGICVLAVTRIVNCVRIADLGVWRGVLCAVRGQGKTFDLGDRRLYCVRGRASRRRRRIDVSGRRLVTDDGIRRCHCCVGEVCACCKQQENHCEHQRNQRMARGRDAVSCQDGRVHDQSPKDIFYPQKLRLPINEKKRF